MILKLESVLICKMSNYTAKGLRTILEAKLLKFSVRKEQDRLAGKNENVFSYGQVGNRPSLAFAECLTKCEC
jgi:hypothetical protein